MEIKINDEVIKVDVCVTKEDISKGMQGKKFSNELQGMLFILELEEHVFWTKDCLIPMDIIFIKDNTIVDIYKNCPPCLDGQCERYSSYCNTVLELPNNYCEKNNINVGDTFNII